MAEMVRIPGGKISLGIELTLERFLARFPKHELDTIDEDNGTTYRRQLTAFYKTAFAKRHVVRLAPFWIEVAPKHVGRDYGSSFQTIVAKLAREGHRLPTPDEWEHAHAAGARTLFAWGDAPSTSRRRRWKNAFGVTFERSGTPECTSTHKIFKGGDGGSTSHGGFPYAYLTQASSFVETSEPWDSYTERIWYGDCVVRRVRSEGI